MYLDEVAVECLAMSICRDECTWMSGMCTKHHTSVTWAGVSASPPTLPRISVHVLEQHTQVYVCRHSSWYACPCHGFCTRLHL